MPDNDHLYVVTVGGQTYRLDGRLGPGDRARLVSLVEGRPSVPEQARLTRELLSHMLDDAERADELLALLDLREVVRLITNAVRQAQEGEDG